MGKEEHRFKEQLKGLRKRLDQDPSSVEDCLEIAKFYFLEEEYEKALAVEREILGTHPEHLGVLYNMAICFMAQERKDQAKHTLHRILALNPNHEAALRVLEQMTS